MPTKADRAITALREAADALDALPSTLRRTALLGASVMVNTGTLRNEADWIEGVIRGIKEGLEE